MVDRFPFNLDKFLQLSLHSQSLSILVLAVQTKL